MVSDRSGVEGRYFDLEQAKDILRSITSGAKLIAEVVDNNKLLTDPHVISGQPQVPESGFHKAWGDWSVILRLMDVAEKYLQNVEGMINKIFVRLCYILIQQYFSCTTLHCHLQDAMSLWNARKVRIATMAIA